MALYEFRTFQSGQEAENYFNGAHVGTKNLFNGANVDGKTLIVDIGAGDVTVTFAPAKNAPWTIDEIVAKINGTATLTGLASKQVDKLPASSGPTSFLRIFKDVVTCTIKSTGTANPDLGFSDSADTVRTPVQTTEIISGPRFLSSERDTWVTVLYR